MVKFVTQNWAIMSLGVIFVSCILWLIYDAKISRPRRLRRQQEEQERIRQLRSRPEWELQHREPGQKPWWQGNKF